jgi:hypothetical protein
LLYVQASLPSPSGSPQLFFARACVARDMWSWAHYSLCIASGPVQEGAVTKKRRSQSQWIHVTLLSSNCFLFVVFPSALF